MFFHLLEKTIHQTFRFTVLCKSAAKGKRNIEQNPIFLSPETICSIMSLHSSLRVGLEEDYLYIHQFWWSLTMER
jgi:hypothetical protein